MNPFPDWPIRPVKQLIAVHGTNDFYLKARETSEQLVPAAPKFDGGLSYQLYFNKAAKLVGYKFSLETMKIESELVPRVTMFSSSVMASYVPSAHVNSADQGVFSVIYHDLNVRLIKRVAPDPFATYWIIMRSKLDNIT